VSGGFCSGYSTVDSIKESIIVLVSSSLEFNIFWIRLLKINKKLKFTMMNSIVTKLNCTFAGFILEIKPETKMISIKTVNETPKK
jgi:hypothetical protein